MTIAYLNGEYIPLEEAKISPMDRGFLFGDGIYEVIPSYGGRTIGTALHLIRFEKGLYEIGIDAPWSRADLKAIFDGLLGYLPASYPRRDDEAKPRVSKITDADNICLHV